MIRRDQSNPAKSWPQADCFNSSLPSLVYECIFYSLSPERNLIERTIGWLKEFRRIATRYEKLVVNYLGMITLGMILQYLTY